MTVTPLVTISEFYEKKSGGGFAAARSNESRLYRPHFAGPTWPGFAIVAIIRRLARLQIIQIIATVR
jgi:hypothetical protein